MTPSIVLEMAGGDITPHGDTWSQMLNTSGIMNSLLDVSDVLSDPDTITGVTVMLVDASVGSGNGATVSQTTIDLLIRRDITLILMGRSAWILHRLRDAGPPSLVAPATTVLLESAEFAGAAFMITPNTLTVGNSLTSESGIMIPVDQTQTELSRIVDLTGATPSNVASLRHDSFPLDVFLFAPENPSQLTTTGEGLLENIIAFSSALRESGTASAVANQQASAGSLLAGGFRYQHEPTMASTYYAVHSARSLLSSSEWNTWLADNDELVQSVLETLIVDFGFETGFRTSVTEGIINCMSTAQGLWLITTMGLSAQFTVAEITTFLSPRQDVDGGFENDLTTTYHVAEALHASGELGSIDTTDLEDWLRSLVIDGSKTSNPDLWGSIGYNPASLSPTNDNAIKYLRSLDFIGKAHPDPAKLTSWILTRTANGDGSFQNSPNPDEEFVTGTASAISSMELLGTLSSSNRTLGLTWLSVNQLETGGFGMKPKVSDLVAKTRESSRVSMCLNLLSETDGGLANGIRSFLNLIRTDVGFEGMDLLPSLMWSSWMLSINRFSHSSGAVDTDLAESYLSGFGPWTRTKSVWTQYFGALAMQALGIDFSPDMVSEMILYLSQAQFMTGHYRPTSLMGTAHVQHSVAAIETLFLLDELSTIPYRIALESAMLSEYSSGSWDSTGWFLQPFAGSQEAIDFLSTRAAIRLGIVTSTMANEIAASVQARIQYTDLFALSYSVATLSLLNTSSFSIDLESIDRSQVLSALRSSSIAASWYNSSFQRQPIFTEGVLKMVSILGLRPSYLDVTGCTLTTTTGPTVSLGSTLDVDVSITSASSTHSVMVHAFNQWTLFENVMNSDTLSVPIPASVTALGQEEIFVIVNDWGLSKAFDTFSVMVNGVIVGSLNLDTSTAKMGELVNGTVDWSLGGIDAGVCHLTIRLGNHLVFNEWTYDVTSPFAFSVPTSGFDAGVYNVTVIVEKQFCTDLVLTEEVTIAEPNPTYITAPSNLNGEFGEELSIDWSLHFGANSSQIDGQEVTISIVNTFDVVVFTDTGVSQIGGSTFLWTPVVRGEYTFVMTFHGNQSLESSQTSGSIDVFEIPDVTITLPSDVVAPTTQNLIVIVSDGSSAPLGGVTVHCVVTLNGSTIFDAMQVTLADGSITLTCDLNDPGQLVLTATIAAQSWLLDTSEQDSTTVSATTYLSIAIPGQPVEQGSIVGVVITLLDWIGSPMAGSDILVLVLWDNGTVFQSHSEITDEFGMCTLAQDFSEVGDFVINATYSGYGLNVSATDSVSQRVVVTPNVIVTHNPSCIVGDTFEIQVGLTDPLGNYVTGRTISITIEQDSTTVFVVQVPSIDGLLDIQWDPSQGGLATITVLHEGDIHYLVNSTESVASILEHVTSDFWLTPSQVDLFASTILTYNLTSGLRVGITIHFEVLGMDLVPVWSQDVITNSSGISTASYNAIHGHGVLRVNAGPTPEQFLIGGDKQELLIVMTDCTVVTGLEPIPPAVDVLTNITIQVTDELGVLIDGLTVTVSLFDPYSEQVKLGKFTMSVSVTVVEGLATVEFTPEMVGLYTLVVSSSGATSIHSFAESDYHTVYSGTQLQTTVSTHELEVGEILVVDAVLTDHDGNPLAGRNLTLTIDGPGANFIGPLEFVTDASGHIVWSSALDDEGLWTLDISFAGLGVYLPVYTTDDINVRYGTVVQLDLIDTGDVIAGVSQASFSMLLRDTGGTPLEGFTIHYEAYHEILGLVEVGDIIQIGTEPIFLNLTFDEMGNYTIIASFAGTSHYHASNAAIQLWVLGTTEVSAEVPDSVDRASNSTIPISITDETGAAIQLSDLEFTVELNGPQGLVNLTDHFDWNALSIDFTTTSLPVGAYILNITVDRSLFRIGCVYLKSFSIISSTTLNMTDESLSGNVSEGHSFTVVLTDSLDELVSEVKVWVSLYNPTGREIFGSPLTDRTSIDVGSGVSWTPTLVGEYRIFLEFEGDVFLNSTTLELFILIRYPSTLTLDVPVLMEFGEIIPVTATLSGALGTLSGATVILTVISDGVVMSVEILTTDSRGVMSISLVGLLSGIHTIRVSFNGTGSQAPCDNELEVMITPLVVLSIEPNSDLYVGHYCSVNLTVSILGTGSDWTGTLNAWLFDPDGQQLTEWTFSVGVHSIETIGFNAQKLGTHTLNVTLTGLPIVISQDYPMAVVIVDEILQLELDAGTTPLLGGFGIITIIGVVLRKKMKGVVGSLPSEWSE
jgi:prenyltransferase beta subunit